MLDTVHALNQLITAEVDAGTPSDRIIIGGFSQGGAMSLLTGFSSERKLGGAIVLSSWVPLRGKFKAVRHFLSSPRFAWNEGFCFDQMATDHARKLPVFWGHGDSDPLVPFKYGQKSGMQCSCLFYPRTLITCHQSTFYSRSSTSNPCRIRRTLTQACPSIAIPEWSTPPAKRRSTISASGLRRFSLTMSRNR